MDVGKSIGFVFEDENWVPKVLLGGVVSLIPIVDLAVGGYAVRTVRNVALGKERPLPDWNDFGDYFVKGLVLLVASLIYYAPMIALNVTVALAGQFTDSRLFGEAVSAGIAAFACLQALYALAVGVWLPAATINYAASEDFGAFFRFGEIWDLIGRNPGDYVVTLLAYLVVGIVAALVGLVLCGVGALFTGFVAYVIAAHLGGQILRQSERQLAPATA